MKTFIKTILALTMFGVLMACDGGSSNPEAEKNKQDIAELSSQLTELEDICRDLGSTIDLLRQELAAMDSNSADAGSVQAVIDQLTVKLESIESFKADFESKIEAGEITSITPDVTAGLDEAINDVIEAGEAVSNLDVEFTNPALNEKIEGLKESLDSWVEDADDAAQGFGQPDPSVPQVKVKKVQKIQKHDEFYGDIHYVEFEYKTDGKVSRMTEAYVDEGQTESMRYIFDHSTVRKIYVEDAEDNEYALSLDSKGNVFKLVYADDDVYNYEYDADGYMKLFESENLYGSSKFEFSYLNGALNSLSYSVDYGEYNQDSDVIDLSSWFSHKYPNNTINMDINMFLMGWDQEAILYLAPHFGHVGGYFIEKCMSVYGAGDVPHELGRMTDDPNYYETSTYTYNDVLDYQEDFLPLTYTFDSDNCPTEITGEVKFQKYERTITYTAGDLVKQHEDGTSYYEIVATYGDPTPVGEPKVYKQTTTITYCEE